MPVKDKQAYNAYMRQYVLERHERRMAQAKVILGGKCARCGSTKDLDIDHIDPSTKSFGLSKVAAGVSEERFQAELKKCQLLCRDCHNEKTILERGQLPRGDRHGTLTMAKYCKCEECRAAKSAYAKSYHRKSRRRVPSSSGQ